MKNFFEKLKQLKPRGRGIGSQALQAALYFGIVMSCSTIVMLQKEFSWLVWTANILSYFLLIVAIEYLVSGLVSCQKLLRDIVDLIQEVNEAANGKKDE